MAVQRWDPLRDLVQLQERMNRLFEEAFARSSGGETIEPMTTASWRPPIDLVEESERYVLRADVPGLGPGEVDVQLEDGHLVIRGERTLEGGAARQGHLRVERPYGRFAVRVAMPGSVDASRIQASQRNGVLEVVLPKRPAEGAGRVTVTGG
jgi:HSP20 family protein